MWQQETPCEKSGYHRHIVDFQRRMGKRAWKENGVLSMMELFSAEKLMPIYAVPSYPKIIKLVTYLQLRCK